MKTQHLKLKRKKMKQEKKELLLKDLCQRLPYGVIVKDRNGIHKLTPVNTEFTDLFNSNKCNIKPYLRPITSMTEEEKEDLLNYVVGKDSKYFEVCDDVSITDTSPDVQDFKSFNKKWINFNPNTTSRYIKWFLKNHFDFCDLIQKSLALTAPDGMYKI